MKPNYKSPTKYSLITLGLIITTGGIFGAWCLMIFLSSLNKVNLHMEELLVQLTTSTDRFLTCYTMTKIESFEFIIIFIILGATPFLFKHISRKPEKSPLNRQISHLS